MGTNFITAFTVKLETFARQPSVFLVEADDFDQALEAAEERRPLGAQIEQHLVVRQIAAVVVHDYRRDRCQPVVRCAMRDEADCRSRPQHAAEFLARFVIGAERVYSQPARKRFGAQRARGLQLVFDVEVEIDLGQG